MTDCHHTPCADCIQKIRAQVAKEYCDGQVKMWDELVRLRVEVKVLKEKQNDTD
jgi:hypothetical protein